MPRTNEKNQIMSLIIEYKLLDDKKDVKEVMSKETFKLYDQVSFTENHYRLGCYRETKNDSMSLVICVGYVFCSKVDEDGEKCLKFFRHDGTSQYHKKRMQLTKLKTKEEDEEKLKKLLTKRESGGTLRSHAKTHLSKDIDSNSNTSPSLSNPKDIMQPTTPDSKTKPSGETENTVCLIEDTPETTTPNKVMEIANSIFSPKLGLLIPILH